MTGHEKMHRKALVKFVSHIPIKGSIPLTNYQNIYPLISSNPPMKSVLSNGCCLEIDRYIINSFSNNRMEISIFNPRKHGQEGSILGVVHLDMHSSKGISSQHVCYSNTVIIGTGRVGH